MKHILPLGALILLTTLKAHATVEYLGVNDITREYAIFESGGIAESYRPIAWTYYGDRFELIYELQANGYTETSFPYLVEGTIFLFAALLFTLVSRCLLKKK